MPVAPSASSVTDLRARARLPANAPGGGRTIGEFFDANKGALQAVLPKHVTADRMMKVALGAVRSVPKLLECTVESLFGAVVQCAQLGLEPNTPMGHVYLIPFRDNKKGRTDVQVIIGYRGLLDLARRSGQIVSISAHAVRAGDEFDFEFGLDERLRHIPARLDGGEIIAFYAVAKLVGGGVAFDVMWRDAVDRVMKATQSKGAYGPWKDHYEEMGRKGLALDTPIPTPEGWTTMGEIEVGDVVFDMHGNQVSVIAVSEIKNLPCFAVNFGSADTIVCDDEHRWVARIGDKNAHRYPFSVHTVNDMCAAKEDGLAVTIPVQGPIDTDDADLLVDPYLLGYWLGDGSTDAAVITCGDFDLAHVKDMVKASRYSLGSVRSDARSNSWSVGISGGLREDLREIGTLGSKHVPEVYLRGSIIQRRALLQGLMDSDGHFTKDRGKAVFCSVRPELSAAVYELAASLGETPHKVSRRMLGFRVETTAHEVMWKPTFCCVRMQRKRDAYVERKITPYRVVKSIDRIPSVPTRCIAVEGETRTYLAGKSMAPTHNTAIRRLFKYLPVSIEIARAVEIDGRGEAGKDQGLDAVLTGQWSVVDEDSAPEGEPASDNAAPETATTDAPKTSDNSEWLNAADRAAKGV